MNMQMRDIPLNVVVKCCDQHCGRSTQIVLNPVTNEITHLVVKQRALPYTERLVPVGLIEESTPQIIRLNCEVADLDTMEEFIEKEFIPSEATHIVNGPFMVWPYAYSTEEYHPHKHKRIPIGELAIRRGARVVAQDEPVGHVDEFVVDRGSEHITHLVMREGHLWQQKDVTIPVSCIDHIDDNTVYLNVDKDGVAALPTVPIHRG